MSQSCHGRWATERNPDMSAKGMKHAACGFVVTAGKWQLVSAEKKVARAQYHHPHETCAAVLRAAADAAAAARPLPDGLMERDFDEFLA